MVRFIAFKLTDGREILLNPECVCHLEHGPTRDFTEIHMASGAKHTVKDKRDNVRALLEVSE